MKSVKVSKLKHYFKRGILYSLIILVVALFIFPFVWMVFGSFKTNVDLLNLPPRLFSRFTLQNYTTVFLTTDFVSSLINSAIVSGGAVVIGLILGLPSSYAIARYDYRTAAFGILFTRMIPGISLLVPWFILYRFIGILDSYIGLIASHLILTLPMIVWIMIGFFEDLPPEIEESALMDGCNKWQAFYKISLPLVKPGVVTSAILGFIFSWNHFLFALILSGSRTRTLPVIVFQFIQYEEINFGGLYAAATLITLPVIVFVLLIQKQFISGLTMGGVKG